MGKMNDLECCWTLDNVLSCVHQGPATLVFPLSCYDLGPGLSRSLGLCCHGPHELLRNPDILHLNPLHLDSPVVGAVSQQVLVIMT